jgi:hypothetical protein
MLGEQTLTRLFEPFFAIPRGAAPMRRRSVFAGGRRFV